MTDKHTPGPWEPKRIESQLWEIDAPNGDPLLGHWAWQGLAAVYGNDDNKVAGSQVAKANARLIASSPRLLSAAKRVTAAFRAIGQPASVAGLLSKLREECEASMLELDEAIKEANGDTP